MSIITEIIIWVSPFAFGLTLWLAKELYNSIKTDVDDTKKTVHRVEKKQVEHEVKINGLDTKLTGVCNSLEAVKKTTHEIDKRTNGVEQLNGSVKILSERLDQSDKKYGQVLMILDGIAVKLGLKVKRSGS